jgi:hypothetical protein
MYDWSSKYSSCWDWQSGQAAGRSTLARFCSTNFIASPGATYSQTMQMKEPSAKTSRSLARQSGHLTGCGTQTDERVELKRFRAEPRRRVALTLGLGCRPGQCRGDRGPRLSTSPRRT